MFSALGAAVIEVIVIPDHHPRRIECHRLDPDGASVSHPLAPSARLPSLRRFLDGDTSEMPYLVLDVPQVPDAGLFRDMDRVLWVDIDQSVQLARLQARNGTDKDGARRIRQSKPDPAQALRAQVCKLHHIYRELAPILAGEIANDSYRW